MAESQTDGALHVPARAIPVPKHLSPVAQAILAMPLPGNLAAYPALDDRDGWLRHITAGDASILQMIAPATEAVDAEISELREGEALAYDIRPRGLAADDRRVFLDIHGGALIMGGGHVCRAMGTAFAGKVGARVVSVDYRMPPDHPYPAGLDDCLAFYRALLRDHDPSQIIVGGLSAGGSLVGGMVLRARDEGLPLPAAAVMFSPEVDLTESGDSFQTNGGIDGMGSLMQANLLYAAGADLANPYLSPLFGDFTKGFPPAFITAGTRDLFLSNAVRLHRALRNAGVPAELHIQEGATHACMGAFPEIAEIDREMRLFCEKWWAGG
jgi:epsilon-lactone hydrolase